jgi:glycine cleavage system regulatory protein/folate-dependent phosphoribosylglycinamide formyltransferase PurN
MKCTLVGSRYFGAKVLEVLQNDGAQIAGVVAPAADDRLAIAGRAADVPVHVLENPKNVPEDAIAEGTVLIVAAHTHARVSREALARSRLGGVGYHPSLLPRHRGIAAVEWTILEGDPIAGGSVYHLADTMDAGAIAAQDWCFVVKGETARELWERALAPIGLDLLARVVRHARQHGGLPAHPQDERFATKAPMIRRTVSLTEQDKSAMTSIVATVMGPDRPGIVSLLSERAQGFGANWAGSHIATLEGQFAGVVHFEVPPQNAEALAAALAGLQSSGVNVVVAKKEPIRMPAGRRAVKLELVGHDRLGIVSDLSGSLARRRVSIEDLDTEIVSGGTPAEQLFKVRALLAVPEDVAHEELRRALEPLMKEMTVDIALGEQST